MSWSDLASYRVAQSSVPLAPVGWALFGSAFHAIRNMLSVGCDANGLVIEKRALLGASEIYFVPWAHIRRGQPPTFPIATFARETFLLGPSAIALTIPQGLVRAPL